MQVLKINPANPENEIIKKAAEVLRVGGVIIYPTETVYGIGANILDIQAVQRIFEIKKRDISKPISVAFKNLEQVKNFTHFNPIAEKLAAKFLPGPLTIILQTKLDIDPLLGRWKVGVRLINHPVVEALLKETKFPITSTSANISGKKDPLDAQEAFMQVGKRADLILDAGPTKHAMPSTIVDLSNGKLKFVREGAIPKKEIIAATK